MHVCIVRQSENYGNANIFGDLTLQHPETKGSTFFSVFFLFLCVTTQKRSIHLNINIGQNWSGYPHLFLDT